MSYYVNPLFDPEEQSKQERWDIGTDHVYGKYQEKMSHMRYMIALQKALVPCIQSRNALCGISSEPLRVLDLGCGTGDGAKYLKQMSPDYVIVEGVDKSHEPCIEDGVEFIQEDFFDYLESYSKVDVLVCMEVIEHIEEKLVQKLVKTMAQALRPTPASPLGGYAVFSTPRKRPREFTVSRHFHINERTAEDFKVLLRTYFPWVEFLSLDRCGFIVPELEGVTMIGICRMFHDNGIFKDVAVQ